MIKHNQGLFPYYKSDMNDFEKLFNNVVYFIDIKKPRNILHHKKLFAVAKCVIANMPENSVWHNKAPYSLIKAAEMQAGYVDEQIRLDGEVVFIPQSIKFENMDQAEFHILYDKIINIFAVMLNTTVKDLEDYSLEFI